MKYWQYIPILIALLGSVYGGLRIASDLQTTLEINTQLAEDAHTRISGIEQGMDMYIDNQKFALEAMNEKMGYKFEDAQRELIQLNKIVTVLEASLQTIEKNAWMNATTTQLDGLRELIYQQKDKITQLENPIDSRPDLTPMFYELQNRIFELERRVDEHHSGNWN